jgi:hypothetical protein
MNKGYPPPQEKGSVVMATFSHETHKAKRHPTFRYSQIDHHHNFIQKRKRRDTIMVWCMTSCDIPRREKDFSSSQGKREVLSVLIKRNKALFAQIRRQRFLLHIRIKSIILIPSKLLILDLVVSLPSKGPLLFAADKATLDLILSPFLNIRYFRFVKQIDLDIF